MYEDEKEEEVKYGRFFEIPSSSLLADELRFLSRAVSDDHTRYFMNAIWIEKDYRAAATDGRRIHIVKRLHKAADEVYGIQPGFHAVKKSAGKFPWLVEAFEMGTFPEYERVLPTGTPRTETDFYGLDERRHPAKVFDLFYRLPEPTPLNLSYLRDLGDHCFKAKFFKSGKGLLFDSDTRQAVIMPMNFEGTAPAWLPAAEPVAAEASA